MEHSVSSYQRLAPMLAGCRQALAGSRTLQVGPFLQVHEHHEVGSQRCIRPGPAQVRQILWAFQTREVHLKEATGVRDSFQIVESVQKVFLRPAQAETVRRQTTALMRCRIWLQTANDCRAPVVDQPGRRRIPSSSECNFDTALGDHSQQEDI